MSRNRIGKDHELSAVPRSLVVTSAVNEQMYLAPGTNNQVLTIVGGVPTWTAAPADVLTSIAYNGTTGVLSYVDELGTTTNINLPLEKFLSSASLNSTTNILTLTLNDGSTVTVNMTDYLGYNFNIEDTFAGAETVGVGDLITFMGTNGFTATVTPGSNVTFSPPVGTITGQILTWDNTLAEWVVSTPAGSSFTLAGDSGTNNTINGGDTASIVGSRGFTTVSSATDILTITPPAGTATGQVMTWNNTTLLWEPTTPVTGSTFTVAGTAGANQTISAGDTLTITGIANGILVTGTATDTLTISLREANENFDTLTSGTTVIAANNPIASTLRVYRNGRRQQLTNDYTLAGNVVTFGVAFGVSAGAQGGETVELDYRY